MHSQWNFSVKKEDSNKLKIIIIIFFFEGVGGKEMTRDEKNFEQKRMLVLFLNMHQKFHQFVHWTLVL